MRRPALALPLAAAFFATSLGAVSTVQDQSDVDLASRFVISSFLAADDVGLSDALRVATITVWLTDNVANDNGQLDGFSGALSWAFLADDSGAPGVVFASGLDATPEIVDTGLQTSDGHDVLRVRIDVGDGPFGEGTAWLAIHEGPWGSPTDGTSIHWLAAVSTGGSNAYVTADEADPDPGEWVVSLHDAAFVLESDPLVVHAGGLDVSLGASVSNAVSAADFTLSTPTRLTSADVWLGDQGPENGHLDAFSGTLSWAIYTDSGGDPGTPLASGTETAPILEDSFVNFTGSGDIVRARIRLNGGPLVPAGTWWLVIHEGTWLSPGDGSNVYWVKNNLGLFQHSRISDSETNPGSWSDLFASGLAFALFDDSLFASGFDAGVDCAWSGGAGGSSCP